MKLKVDYLLRSLLALFVVIALSSASFAQRTITGTLSDAGDGEPLIGASVLVSGTSTGTITDFDGTYSLNVPEGATSLEFSYTGYATQTMDIGSSNVIDVALSAGTVMDEVVVVGYGTQQVKEVTGSVASVDAEDFNKGNITSPAQLLQGKVAGLSISRPGGSPNATFNVRLRGLSTVGSNAEPLVIVDGVPGVDLNSLNPNDIQSIDVLKDGSAAAIYGTRAASGVIIVTTKTGRSSDRSNITYDGYVTFDNRARTVDILDASQYVAAGGTDEGSNTNWFDALTQTGISNVHDLAISGGNGQTSYRASIGYRDVQGIAINTGFDQLTGRVNLTQKAFDNRLKVSFNLNSTTRDADEGFDYAFRQATIYNPTAPILNDGINSRGGYYQLSAFDYYNPVAILEQNTNKLTTRTLLASIRGDYELVDGLTASVFYSQQRESERRQTYYSKDDQWIGAGRNGLAEQILDNDFDQLLEVTGQYETNFDNVNMKILAGYSYQDFSDDGTYMQAGNFVTDAFGVNNMSAALDWGQGTGIADSYRFDSRLIAFFGRVNFNVDDTYFLSASLRREGSSKFGADNKWGLFPGISAGVNITNLTDMAGVDNLKFRVGYGVTGQQPEDSYQSLSRIGPLADNFYNGGVFVPAYGPLSNQNPNLQWETKSDINVGLDFAFNDYKLTGSLEYYNTTTENMILPFSVPVPPNLFGFTLVNVGELNNSGIELLLNYRAIDNDNFTWNPTLTGTAYLNYDLVSLSNDDFNFGSFRDISNLGSPGQNNTPTVRVEEGQTLGQLWGFNYEGLDDSGKWIFTDNNGDGTIDTEDRAVIGNGIPDFEFGLNNSFTFGGGWDLNVFIRGIVGHDLVNTFRAFYETPNNISSYNILESGTASEFANFSDAPQFSDLYVEDASYVKIDNATIGYSLKNPGKFSRVRFYVTAQNLLVLTGYKGVDPEVRWTDTVEGELFKLGIGIDRRDTYFATRGYTLGVSLGF